MSKVHIDYNQLLSASNELLELKENITEKTISVTELNITDLQNLGKKHDDCFSGISKDSLIEEITKTSNKLLELSQKAITTVDVYSKAESYFNDTLEISSIGLSDALKHQFQQNEEITAGYDVGYYQKILDSLIENGNTTREKTVISALFLATSFPHLPYFWGGGHEEIASGLDASWGTPKLVTAEGSATTGTSQPNSLDCSGYVSWALKNGGYNIDKPMITDELENLGTVKELAGINPKEVQSGDFGYMEGHIGVVVDVEDTKITIAHCAGSGSGMNITTMDATTGKVLDDVNNPERIGKEYFNQIINVNY